MKGKMVGCPNTRGFVKKFCFQIRSKTRRNERRQSALENERIQIADYGRGRGRGRAIVTDYYYEDKNGRGEFFFHCCGLKNEKKSLWKIKRKTKTEMQDFFSRSDKDELDTGGANYIETIFF